MADKEIGSKVIENRSLAYRRYLRHVQGDKNNKSRTGREQKQTDSHLSAVTYTIDNSESISFPNVRRIVRQYNDMLESDKLRVRRSQKSASCHDIVSVNHISGDESECRVVERVPTCESCVSNSAICSENLFNDPMCHQSLVWRARSQPNLLTDEFHCGLKRLDSEMSDEGCPRNNRCEISTPPDPNFLWGESPTFLGLDTISPSRSPVFSLASSTESVNGDGSRTGSKFRGTLVPKSGSAASSDSAVCVDDDELSCVSSSPTQPVKPLFCEIKCPEEGHQKTNYSDQSPIANSPIVADASDILTVPDSQVILRENRGRSLLRTPSVIISDYSSSNIKMHIELEPNEIPLHSEIDQPLNLESEPFNSDEVRLRKVSTCSSSSSRQVQSEVTSCSCVPISRQAQSEFSALRKKVDCFVCSRKISDCSTSSSLSTLDLNPLESSGSLSVGYDWSKGYLSDGSSCSYITASEDETEVTPSRPTIQVKKTSNWRKVRNVVQWTPFIQTYKRHKYPWVQLAGHQGNFKAGYTQGTILKKLCPAEESALEAIKKDIMQPYVPQYMGVIESSDGDKYLQLQDLLTDFTSPCVMDIKMGVRTYLEEELAKARHKPKLRKDMFEKMVQIDPNAPTDAEHKAKAVTKPRYMVWRETISSTATLGFRIEGVRRGDGTSTKDFKTTRTRDQVLAAFEGFLEGYSHNVPKYIQRLKAIQATLEGSKFFHSHELIGSSLLFVHNEEKADVWLIDFAKTIPLPNSVKVTHKRPWVEGTHEDGYLIGLGNLIDLLDKYRQNFDNAEVRTEKEAGEAYVQSRSKITDSSKPAVDTATERLEQTKISSGDKSSSETSKMDDSRFAPDPKELPCTVEPSSQKTESHSTINLDSAPSREPREFPDVKDGMKHQPVIQTHFPKNMPNNLSESFETKCQSFQMPKNAE